MTVSWYSNSTWHNANRHSSEIISRIEALAAQASALRSAAESAYTSVAFMPLPSLPDMQLQATISNYNTIAMSLPAAPNFNLLPVSTAAFSSLPTLDLDSFDKSSIPAPNLSTLDFPSTPDLSLAAAGPQPLNLAGVPDVPQMPNLSISVASLPSLGSAPILNLSPVVVNWSDFLPPQNISELSVRADIGLVQAAIMRKFEPEDYNYKLLQDALTFSDEFLAGGFGYSIDDANSTADLNLRQASFDFNSRITNLWGRRGFFREDSNVRATFATNVATRVESELFNFQQALNLRARMRGLPQIIQTLVAGHAAMADIKRQFYELDFAFLMTEYEAQQQFVDSLSNQLRKRVSQYRLVSAQYELLIAQIRANVEAHLAFVRAEQAKAQMNDARASAYVAQQAAQSAHVQAFEAHYQAALAVVDAYNTMMQSLQTRAKAAGAELARFKAQSESWGAQLLSAKAELDVRAAQNRSIVAQNQLLAAQVNTGAVSAEAAGAAAQAAATDVAVQAAILKAQLMQRLGSYLELEQSNTSAGVVARLQATENELNALRFGATVLPLTANYSALSDINNSVASTSTAITSAAISTARDLQRLRSQLADAYLGMYRALADAEAARVAGEASRIRADVRLSARGDVEHTSRDVGSISSNTSRSTAESVEKVTLFRPLTH